MLCLTPFRVKKDTGEEIPVPCGKCPPCMKRRASGWSFRLIKQADVSTSALFVTLTYDTKNVPISGNGFMSLNKRDLQLFWKRLRKAHGDNYPFQIKYYVCGEYGGKSFRPHYHALVFNAQVQMIEDSWKLGMVHYGEVNGASVGYTLKYMMKPSRIPMHRNDDRIPEFSNMSKGLGTSYLTEQMIAWHKADVAHRVHIVIEDGKRIAMPRYYKDKIYSEDEKDLIGVVNAKECSVRLDEEMTKLVNEYGDEQLRKMVRERNLIQYEKMYREAEKNRDSI